MVLKVTHGSTLGKHIQYGEGSMYWSWVLTKSGSTTKVKDQDSGRILAGNRITQKL